MERDFDTFDPSEALVDEGRNLYYPAGWQKGDPVYALNEHVTDHDSWCVHRVGSTHPGADCGVCERGDCDTFYELEQRKGLDCE